MSGAQPMSEASALAVANALGIVTHIQRIRLGNLAKMHFPYDYMDVGGRVMQRSDVSEQMPSRSILSPTDS
jgi:hypothetical protein